MDIDITKIEPNSVYIICPVKDVQTWTEADTYDLAEILSRKLKSINSEAILFREHVEVTKKE